MATVPSSARKLSNVERGLIIRALDNLHSVQMRASRAATDDVVKDAYLASAERINSLRSVVLNSELEF